MHQETQCDTMASHVPCNTGGKMHRVWQMICTPGMPSQARWRHGRPACQHQPIKYAQHSMLSWVPVAQCNGRLLVCSRVRSIKLVTYCCNGRYSKPYPQTIRDPLQPVHHIMRKMHVAIIAWDHVYESIGSEARRVAGTNICCMYITHSSHILSRLSRFQAGQLYCCRMQLEAHMSLKLQVTHVQLLTSKPHTNPAEMHHNAEK